MIILLSRSFLCFSASSGDKVASAELGEVGEISNWIAQLFPVQPSSQKHWFKFEQVCEKYVIIILCIFYGKYVLMTFITILNCKYSKVINRKILIVKLNFNFVWFNINIIIN